MHIVVMHIVVVHIVQTIVVIPLVVTIHIVVTTQYTVDQGLSISLVHTVRCTMRNGLELCGIIKKWFVCNLVKKYRFLLGAIQNFHQTVAVSLDNRDLAIQENIFRSEYVQENIEIRLKNPYILIKNKYIRSTYASSLRLVTALIGSL